MQVYEIIGYQGVLNIKMPSVPVLTGIIAHRQGSRTLSLQIP